MEPLSSLVAVEIWERTPIEVREWAQLMTDHLKTLEAENRRLHARLDAIAKCQTSLPLPAEVWEPLPQVVKDAITSQQVRLAAVEAKLAELQREMEKLRRSSKRQAGPFSKGQPKSNPKRPGRRVGHAGARRPVPTEVDETIELTLDRCPGCMNAVNADCVEDQYVQDFPPVRPRTIHYRVHSAWCKHCRKRVRHPHPGQVSQASGAAGVQLGPNAIAVAGDMKHRLGIPYRKIAILFVMLFGLRVSPLWNRTSPGSVGSTPQAGVRGHQVRSAGRIGGLCRRDRLAYRRRRCLAVGFRESTLYPVRDSPESRTPGGLRHSDRHVQRHPGV